MPIFVEPLDPRYAEVDAVISEISAVLRKHKCCLAAKEGQAFLLIKYDNDINPRPLAEVFRIDREYMEIVRKFADPRIVKT